MLSASPGQGAHQELRWARVPGPNGVEGPVCKAAGSGNQIVSGVTRASTLMESPQAGVSKVGRMFM